MLATQEIYYIIITLIGAVLSLLFSFLVWLLKRYIEDFEDIKKNVAEINVKMQLMADIQIHVKEHDRRLQMLDNVTQLTNKRLDDLMIINKGRH